MVLKFGGIGVNGASHCSSRQLQTVQSDSGPWQVVPRIVVSAFWSANYSVIPAAICQHE